MGQGVGKLRRQRLWAYGAALVALVCALFATPSPRPAEARQRQRPNVLVIITDDQPRGTFSAMRSSQRWLKRSGVSFPNSFTAVPQCCPSRASIMTGQYPHNHEVWDTHSAPSLDHTETIQRYLQDAGYRTGYFGKYLNSWPIDSAPPYFDRWAVHPIASYVGGSWNVDGAVIEVPTYSTTFISDEVTDFIEGAEAADSAPWLAYVAPDAPHFPYVVEPRYEDAPVRRWRPGAAVFEDDPDVDPTMRTDKPEYVQRRDASRSIARETRRSQLRTLMSVDDMIIDLKDTLRRLDEGRNTLVVFTSDNGFTWAHHGWRGKAVPYAPSVRVPLMLRWPAGNVGDHERDDRLVSNVDLAPTILDATGVSLPAGSLMDGRSLLDQSWARDHVLIEFRRSESGNVPPWASLRSRSLHYTEYYDESTLAPIFEEYYDLSSDPQELVNLLGDLDTLNDPPATTQEDLAAQLQADRNCEGTAGPLACP